MKIGNAKVDFEGLLIDGPEGRQSMELKVMGLLRVLVDNAGKVMTREDLISAVWGVEYGGDESLSRGISLLRKALGDKRGQHTHIVTVSRVGYRFIADVDRNYKPEELESLKPDFVTPSQDQSLSERDSIAETEPIKGSTSLSTSHYTPKATTLPVKRLTTLAGLMAAGIAVIFLIVLGGRTGKTLSLQAKMEQGFSHIENFTPKGAIEDAQDIFSAILSDDPNHAAARAGLAFALFREYTHLERDPALLQRAKAHAEAALRDDEHLAIANIAVAWAAEFDGDFERAHKYLDRADILDARNKLTMEGRYRTFGKEGKPRKAKEIINAAIGIYPNQSLFYTYRGNYFDRIGEFPASEVDYRKAMELSPDNSRTYAELAHSLHSQGNTNEAVLVVQQGLNINETALLYNNLGTYLFFQGQYDFAASAFEKTLELSGDSHDYLYWANLGDAYRWSDDKKEDATISYQRALQLLQVDLDRYSGDVNLKSRAALFNAKLGNLDKARQYMDNITLTSDSPPIQLYRSVVTYEILSDRPKALEYLEATIKADYPMIEILNDPELAQLRQDPGYHRLLAKTQN